MNTDKIPVIRGADLKSRGQSIPTVIGAITVRSLSNKGFIPYYDDDKGTGYQREPRQSRINELAQKIRSKEVDLPTAILISVRKKYDEVVSSREKSGLVLDISSVDFYIVDGQHRYLALKQLVEKDGVSPDFKIPFVAMIGANSEMEMLHFHVVNSTAKSVPTNLALVHLRKLAESDPEGPMVERLIGTGQGWKVDGMYLLDEMRKISIWRGCIRMPNAEKAKTTIPVTSMVNSFEPLLKSSRWFSKLPTQKQAQILDAYWRGIQKVMPDPFVAPSEYSLQKGVGVRVMHGILPDVIEIVRGKGSWFSPDTYAEVLKEPLMKLTGESVDSGIVNGADFWFSGNRGVAGHFTSGAGIRILTDKIRHTLPEIEIEDIE